MYIPAGKSDDSATRHQPRWNESDQLCIMAALQIHGQFSCRYCISTPIITAAGFYHYCRNGCFSVFDAVCILEQQL